MLSVTNQRDKVNAMIDDLRQAIEDVENEAPRIEEVVGKKKMEEKLEEAVDGEIDELY